MPPLLACATHCRVPLSINVLITGGMQFIGSTVFPSVVFKTLFFFYIVEQLPMLKLRITHHSSTKPPQHLELGHAVG